MLQHIILNTYLLNIAGREKKAADLHAEIKKWRNFAYTIIIVWS